MKEYLRKFIITLLVAIIIAAFGAGLVFAIAGIYRGDILRMLDAAVYTVLLCWLAAEIEDKF